jgi:hypothetical protein
MEILYVAQVLFMFPGYGMASNATNLTPGKPHLYNTYEECRADVAKVQPLADVIPDADLKHGKLVYICIPVGGYR